MKDATSLCPNLSPYPYGLRLSTGHVVDTVPIIAGGYSSGSYWSYVHKHDRQTNSWISLGNMAKPRNQFTSVPLNRALWVLGGYTGNGMEKSTELIFPNGTIVGGPDLPAPRARHCAVTLKDGKIIILGGEPDKSVITFDPTTSAYTSGPDMLNGRENFGCAHFYSDAHFGRPVVLAAGGLGTSKAEILDYSGSGTWTSSKLLLNLNTIGGRWYFGRVHTCATSHFTIKSYFYKWGKVFKHFVFSLYYHGGC